MSPRRRRGSRLAVRARPPAGGARTNSRDAEPVRDRCTRLTETSALPSRRPDRLRDPTASPGTPTVGPAARTWWVRQAGGSAAREAAKRRHPVRNFFRVLLILLLLFILWLVAVPAYAWTQVARVDAAPSGQRPADQPGKTFLLVGSDSRAGLSKAEQKRLGTGNTEASVPTRSCLSTFLSAASRR